MFELTVEEASAIIAAGIAILQFIIPYVLSLVLAGNLSDSHSAVAWSVVSRFFLNSNWPLVLRSDAIATSAIPQKIAIITCIKPVTLLVAAVAAIVTPLGLHDGIYLTTRLQNVTFQYVAGRGPVGTGTMGRDTYHDFSRICQGTLCPGEPYLGENIAENLDGEMQPYPLRSPEIPQYLVDLYQSGTTEGTPLSSFFDVQYRQWLTELTLSAINNSSYLRGSYKKLASFVLNDRYEVLEGIVLDMADGSIGFRNHSTPAGLTYGAEWEEDLLFLEPESACVDTNISFFYNSADIHKPSGAGIVDRGGFVGLNQTDPYEKSAEHSFIDSQCDAMLYERAYYAAWGSHVLTMEYLNLTEPKTNLARISSKLSQKFQLNTSEFDSSSAADLPYIVMSGKLSTISEPPDKLELERGSTPNYNPEVPNPFNITNDTYLNHQKLCATTFSGDPVNITEQAVTIGVVAGAGKRANKGFENDTDISAPNSTWETPIYICADTTRAIIMTVRFRYNSTADASLSGLSIVSFKDKKYDDKSSSTSPPI